MKLLGNSWERDQFFKAAQYQNEIQDKSRPEAATEPDKVEQNSYEKEAKQMLEGKKTWRPTWQALGLSYDRSLLGSKGNGSAPSS